MSRRRILFLLLIVAAAGLVILLAARTADLLLGWSGGPPGPGGRNLAAEGKRARAELALELGLKLRSASSGKPAPIWLSEEDLRGLMLAALEADPRGRKLLESAQEAHVRIGEGQVELGLLLDPGRLAEQPELPDAIRGLLPLLGGRPLYVGARGSPAASGGRVRFGADVRVLLGQLDLSLESLGERLRLDQGKLERELEVGIPGHRVESVEVWGRELRLKVARAG